MHEAVARRALGRWGLEDAALRFVSARENVVYEVTAPDGARFALRIHRPGYHSWDELVSEHAWTAALEAEGIRVPPPMSTLDGEPYARVLDDAGQGQIVGLIGWCPGVSLAEMLGRDGESRVEWYRRLGTLAARLHAHAERWVRPDGFTRHHLDAEGLMGAIPWWGPFWEAPEWSSAERAEVERARDLLHRWLARQPTDGSVYGVIHADLLVHNLLCDGESIAAIDFDDAGFGWYLYDISVALVGMIDEPDGAEVVAAFFDGYRTVRPMTEQQAGDLTVFVLCRRLATIGWYHTRMQGVLVNSAGKVLERDEMIRPLLQPALDLWATLESRLG